MPIKKRFAKTKPVCKVTFSIEAKDAQTASVAGDFNGWDANAGLLTKQKNGVFKGVFDLPKDASFEFRYVVDGNYRNEPEADAFRHNDFAGTNNSVLNT
ncbi:isoamylase early set domain-containing protein [Flavobacterium selenitireducens]|uniref:isoamylase early set domain-containing protein n=1 Tax=Flavobacterium selenitireducens TaxID=2722704 RepID=UPI00168C02E4|nr:isoamylase early set domain-containing protein [Flavobacterium selenitireducens]MBD3583164.1 glycoside hydrolase [Flavobacterium selenitireducens]